MKELLDIVRERRAQPAIPFALATVVRVIGSSYRKPGARMLMNLNGRVTGSVSGGCLERDVITRARAVILGGTADLAVYDTTDQDDMAFGTSLGCEGRIEILVQPLSPGEDWPLGSIVDAVVKRCAPIALVTVFRAAQGWWTGRSVAIDETPPAWRPQLGPVATAVLADKIPAYLQLDGGRTELLVERLAPPTRLVIFGAGHDVAPLVRLAKEIGYHVTVVDRRADFAEPARFPGADSVCHRRPHEVDDLLAEETAAVVMNHHYETDAELLVRLIGRPLVYLGMLGPRRRTLKILREAQAAGISLLPEALEKVHSPVGLDLGSETPGQIALCILAELQAVVNGRTAIKLRKRTALVDELFGRHVELA